MSPLLFIFAASLAGGVLSILAAAGTLSLDARWIPNLVSFAVGALLGAVFLELLPHALEEGTPMRVMVTVLIGLLAFFILEKLVLWRHLHGHAENEAMAVAQAMAHDHGRSGLMILIGGSVHNFCDGVVIAAAFLTNATLGLTTTVAIVAHAVPQQVGDFAVLLHSGYARREAFGFNLLTGGATVVGALASYYALSSMEQALPTTLAIASASLLYVAVADLIPSLHKRPEPRETVRQVLLIGLGLAVIGLAHHALEP